MSFTNVIYLSKKKCKKMLNLFNKDMGIKKGSNVDLLIEEAQINII